MGEKKPFKVRTGGESATKYSGVVLVVILYSYVPKGGGEDGLRKMVYRKQEGQRGGGVKREQ